MGFLSPNSPFATAPVLVVFLRVGQEVDPLAGTLDRLLARRLTKVHTASRRARPRAGWRWRELDCANSSDALLMNIFCYQRTLRNPALAALLGTETGAVPSFGFRPAIPLRDEKADRTEVDLRLGTLLAEAKLNEAGFQTAPFRMVERCRDFEEVFEGERLRSRAGTVSSY